MVVRFSAATLLSLFLSACATKPEVSSSPPSAPVESDGAQAALQGHLGKTPILKLLM